MITDTIAKEVCISTILACLYNRTVEGNPWLACVQLNLYVPQQCFMASCLVVAVALR